MAKYLDKSGVTYLWNKIKGLFTDQSLNTKNKTYAGAINEINTKVGNLTGAFLWKGKFDTLPAVTDYEAGNVIGVGKKEYVLTVTEGTKAWEEFGDEGSYLLKSAAEETYLKKAAGEVKTANLADNAVISTKLDKGARKPIILTPSTTEVDEETYQKLLSDDVDVLLKSNDDGYCQLTYKFNGDTACNFYFTVLSAEGDSFEDTYLYGYHMSINNTAPHKVTFELLFNTDIHTLIDNSGFINKSTFSPVLQEIDLTGTDADRKAKLDKFATDWKALTGASDLTGARFVGIYIGNDNLDRTALFILRFSQDSSIATYEGISMNSDNGYDIISKNMNEKVSVNDYNGSLTITPLFSHLEPIEIFDDNSIESKKKNIDNINTYKANLEKLGVDTSISFQVPIYRKSNLGVEESGFLIYSNLPDAYKPYSGLFMQVDETSFNIFGISSTGEFIEQTYYLANINYSSLTTTSKKVIDAINEVNALVKKKADKSLNAKSLEAITIKTGNTPDDNAANVAAIKAYVDNLIALGVDVTKGYMIPCKFPNSVAGVLSSVSNSLIVAITTNGRGELNCYEVYIGGDNPGAVYSIGGFQSKTSSALTTTSKQIVGAINEINAFAKGKASNITDGTETGSLKQSASMVLSKDAIALGSTTSAGTKGFRYTTIDFTTKTITLEKALTASIGAGALLSIINDKHYDKCSKVAETAAIGATTIKVKSLPFTSIAEDTGDDAKTIMVYSNPAVGDMDLGDGAHSEGVNTKATQRGSHAEGRDTYAAGQYSHAEGRETEAFYASHAEGRGSKATGDVSHAEGLGTYAIGDHTHAEGQNTHAVGLNAHAEGLRGWANGQHSHAEGVDTVTSNTAEHAEGKFNKSNKADGSFGSAGNTLHSIGIGTSASDRKNAFEIMQNGDAYLLRVGGYDGKNPTASKAVQQVIGALLDTFKPVQVNDNKSGATDATQLAEIKAYAAKLATYGVDTTNGYEIPILYNSGSKGFIGYNPNAASSFNGYAVTPEGNLYTLTMNATTGALSKKILATTTVTDALSANKQPKTDAALKTTSKTVTSAINEVNDKTAYVAFTDVTKLSTNLGKRLIYKGGNVTLSSPITINSNIYEIDFNGATLTVGSLAKTGISVITGHSHCIIKNLVVSGTWSVNTGVVNNIIDTFAGVENVSIKIRIDGTHYGRGFNSCQRLINCKAEIYGTNITQGRAYNYCEYLYMCRVGSSHTGIGFYGCKNMDSCDVFKGYNLTAVYDCSNYTKISYYAGDTIKYISDIDNISSTSISSEKISIDGTDISNVAKLSSVIKDSSESVNSTIIINPSNKIPSKMGVVIGNEDNGGTGYSDNPTVVVRNTSGNIFINDGHYNGIGCTTKYAAYLVEQNKTDISGKQDKLISGTNIKTINNQTLLGSGDITISGGGGDVTAAGDNTFTGTNTFDTVTNLNSGLIIRDATNDDRYKIHGDAFGLIMQNIDDLNSDIGIRGVLSPVQDNDAANKSYVDTQISTTLGTVLTQLQNI